MLLLGIDLGTSSVKVAVLDAATGMCLATAQYPDTENPIISTQPGWAEQSPDSWWEQVQLAIRRVVQQGGFDPQAIGAIGIAYQMHGLVCVDKDGKVLRNSIIWCDSRAVPYGEQAYAQLGGQQVLPRLLNSPGNFTAAKLAWVKEQEPDLYRKIRYILWPGDFIAFRLTGDVTTTPSALSEGIFWDFSREEISKDILRVFDFPGQLLPPVQEVFSIHGELSKEVARQLGLKAGIPVSYKAGDQPNNAFSLQVLQPGEIAATAGTSGVVYGITDAVNYDPSCRVNSFIHVNHRPQQKRIGVLLCVNGTGIFNSWLRQQCFPGWTYTDINQLAATVAPGSEGVLCYPFGNGAERVLQHKEPGASVKGLQFNRHTHAHLARAAQEGIAFALHYGIEVMRDMGMTLTTVRAGKANLFLSPVFSSTFAHTTGCRLELYNTDGATGAARAAGWGACQFANTQECFRGMNSVEVLEPEAPTVARYHELYHRWKKHLDLNNLPSPF